MLRTNLTAGFTAAALLGLLTSVSSAQSAKFPSFQESSAQPKTAQQAAPVPMPTDQQAPKLFPRDGETSMGSAQPIGGSRFPLTMRELERKLQELGISATRTGQRLDLAYQAELEEQEVEVFFSLILNNNQSVLRIRAWLDPLPTGKIPEEYLLELLSANANMESGLTFGYSKQNQRFLLEKIVTNRGMTSAELDEQMLRVSQEVTKTWMLWATSEWTIGPDRLTGEPEQNAEDQTLLHDKFEMPIRR